MASLYCFRAKAVSKGRSLVDDEATVLRYSKLLGLDLSPPRAVILIDASDYILVSSGSQHLEQETVEARVRRRAQLVIGSVVGFFHLPNDTICAYIGDGEVAVLKASDTKNLVTWANSGDVPEQSNSSWANLTALNRAARSLLVRLLLRSMHGQLNGKAGTTMLTFNRDAASQMLCQFLYQC